MNRATRFVVTASLCLAWWACTEGAGPTGSGGAAALGLSFSFHEGALAVDPIDRIRLTAFDVSTDEVVGSVDEAVSPSAPQWALSLDIDLGDASSMQVMVEAQLLSGATVAWSGRIGPITVPGAAPALAMDVYPGPLDNLDVLAVEVAGAVSPMVAGTSTTLTAAVELIAGSTATPIVFWASSDTLVARVTPEGATATVTAVAAGSAVILAAAGTAVYEFPLTVLAAGAASKIWIGGDATDPTAWSVASNWSPPGVPGDADDVLVPTTANDPELDVAAAVRGLNVAAGATLDLLQQDMVVTGALQVGGALVNGDLILTGSTGALQGNLDGLLLTGDRTVTGTLTLTGDLSLAAALTVGSQFVAVGGDLLTQPAAGRLVMTSASGIVSVDGSAVFGGASEAGFLTAGQLQVDGDFTATGDSPESFAATGAHVVALNGLGAQAVDFSQPGASAGRFNNLYIENAAGVSLSTDAYVSGDVFVDGLLTVGSGQTLSVGDVFTLEIGATLQVEGTVTAGGGCVNQGATITGSGTHPCGSGPAASRTWIGGTPGFEADWGTAANWSPAGVPSTADTVLVQGSNYNPVLSADAVVASITVAGLNSIDLAGFTMTVTGDVNAGNNGILSGLVEVTGPGAILQGAFNDLLVNADRSLTGTSYVFANLTLGSTLDTNGQALSVVADLLVESPNGRLVMNDPNAYVGVFGNATFNGADHTGALTEGVLQLLGDLVATDASATSFVSSANHVVSFAGSADQGVTFQVSGPAQQRLNNVTISSSSGVTFSNAHATGDVEVFSRMTVPLGSTVTIGGTLTLFQGSIFDVDGTVQVTNCLNSGAIILGSGTQPCGTPIAVDRVWFGGIPGFENDWGTAGNWSPSGVPTSSETVLIPSAAYPPLLATSDTVAALTTTLSSSLDLGGNTLVVSGDLALDGIVDNGTIEVSGPDGVLSGVVGDLRITADRSVTGYLQTIGDLSVEARVSVGAATLYVGGDLFVQTENGELVMTDVNSVVYALGDATFDGASLDGDLTDGLLYLAGSLTVSDAWATDAFKATGTHTTYFAGSADQLVSFSNPGLGAGEQSLAFVWVLTDPGALVVTNGAAVTQRFSANAVTLRQGGSAALEIGGILELTTVVLDGLPLRLDSQVNPATHTVKDVSFVNMPGTVSQLYVRLPGAGDQQVLTLDGISFPTPPPSFPGYYIEAENATGDQPDLYIVLTNNPQPNGNTGMQAVTTDLFSFIIWP